MRWINKQDTPSVRGSKAHAIAKNFDGRFAWVRMRTHNKDSTWSTLASAVPSVSMTHSEHITNLSISKSQDNNLNSKIKTRRSTSKIQSRWPGNSNMNCKLLFAVFGWWVTLIRYTGFWCGFIADFRYRVYDRIWYVTALSTRHKYSFD